MNHNNNRKNWDRSIKERANLAWNLLVAEVTETYHKEALMREEARQIWSEMDQLWQPEETTTTNDVYKIKIVLFQYI